jgi:S1-C subfamily serine protease
VTRLYDKGPAASAGLKEGDVITHVDGVEVADARAVYYRLTTKGIGQTARLTAIRKGQPVDIFLPLIGAPKPSSNDARNISGNNPLDGARLSNILPSIADELGIDDTQGVAVTSVRSGSAAQTLGFQPGDIIVAIEGKKIDSVTDAEKLLSERQRLWQISVKRGSRVVQLQVPG